VRRLREAQPTARKRDPGPRDRQDDRPDRADRDHARDAAVDPTERDGSDRRPADEVGARERDQATPRRGTIRPREKADRQPRREGLRCERRDVNGESCRDAPG